MRIVTKDMAHQTMAVDKLLPLRVGALFMEMGLGKSRTIAVLAARREKRVSKAIWYCPVSLKETVSHEIRKHTDSGPSDICVFDDKTNQRSVPEAFWYVIGIESMSLSDRIIFTANQITDERTMVVVDESEYIKGHRSLRTKWITQISEKARYRMISTGTPISQGVVDLYAQFYFLSPKILGYRSFYSFSANHLEYSEKYPGLIVKSHNTDYIAAKIAPYTFQATKAECLDLPKKRHASRYFEMTHEQRDCYECTKEQFLTEIDPDKWDSYVIFQLFTALQRITSGYHKTDDGRIIDLPHGRIGLLGSVIDRIPENEKVIIWCKYHYDIIGITKYLRERYNRDAFAEFHGNLNENRRNAEINRFRNESRFIVTTGSCGGHGLTLNEANFVVFYNNSFKYSERLQSEDRNHRIGQDREVTYIDLICERSIDERIDLALTSKGNTVDAFKREMDMVAQEDRWKAMIKGL